MFCAAIEEAFQLSKVPEETVTCEASYQGLIVAWKSGIVSA